MKVCIVSQSDHRGGAYIAAYRLHQGLRNLDVESVMLVRQKNTDNLHVIAPATLWEKEWTRFLARIDYLPLNIYQNRDKKFTYHLEWVPDTIVPRLNKISPDIINLHWINEGSLQIETLSKLNLPIVWTLHDMWAFTGGCHYSGDCDLYKKSCGTCPQLNSNTNWDLSRWVWQRKRKAWNNLNLTIVTPSRWLAKCASESALFRDLRIEVIPNGLDIHKYKPVNRSQARNILGLPVDKKLILFGAINATSDYRKGFQFLQPALKKLSYDLNLKDGIELVIFGSSRPETLPELGFISHYVGKLNDDISLALLYSAVDVFVAPSIEDNLPNTVMEALACGTPCVSFDIGGMSDMIDHQKNGYLAKPFDIKDLASGISWVLDNSGSSLGDSARKKVEREFSTEIQANKYILLYEELKNI